MKSHKYKDLTTGMAVEVVELSASDDDDTCTPPKPYEPLPSCPICLNDILDLSEKAVTDCMHTFCRPCLTEWLRVKRLCPLCKRRIRHYITHIVDDRTFTEIPVPPSPTHHSAHQSHHHHHHHSHQVSNTRDGGDLRSVLNHSSATQAGNDGPAVGDVRQALSRAGNADDLVRQLHRIADRLAEVEAAGPYGLYDTLRTSVPRFRLATAAGSSSTSLHDDPQQQHHPQHSRDANDRRRRGEHPGRGDPQRASTQPNQTRQPRPYFFRLQQRLAAAAAAVVGAPSVASGGGSGVMAQQSGLSGALWRGAGEWAAALTTDSVALSTAGVSGLAGDTGTSDGAREVNGGGGPAATGVAPTLRDRTAEALVARRRVHELGLWATGWTDSGRGGRSRNGTSTTMAAGGVRGRTSGGGGGEHSCINAGSASAATAVAMAAAVRSGGRRQVVEQWVARELQALLGTNDLTLLRALVSGLLDVYGLERDWSAEVEGEERRAEAAAGRMTATEAEAVAAGRSPTPQEEEAEPQQRRQRQLGFGRQGLVEEQQGSGDGLIMRRTAAAAAAEQQRIGRQGVRAAGSRGSGGGSGTVAAGGRAPVNPVAALRPFLFERAAHFWHELRCFGLSGLSLQAYDSSVRYGVGPPAPSVQHFTLSAAGAGGSAGSRPGAASDGGATGATGSTEHLLPYTGEGRRRQHDVSEQPEQPHRHRRTRWDVASPPPPLLTSATALPSTGPVMPSNPSRNTATAVYHLPYGTTGLLAPSAPTAVLQSTPLAPFAATATMAAANDDSLSPRDPSPRYTKQPRRRPRWDERPEGSEYGMQPPQASEATGGQPPQLPDAPPFGQPSHELSAPTPRTSHPEEEVAEAAAKEQRRVRKEEVGSYQQLGKRRGGAEREGCEAPKGRRGSKKEEDAERRSSRAREGREGRCEGCHHGGSSTLQVDDSRQRRSHAYDDRYDKYCDRRRSGDGSRWLGDGGGDDWDGEAAGRKGRKGREVGGGRERCGLERTAMGRGMVSYHEGEAGAQEFRDVRWWPDCEGDKVRQSRLDRRLEDDDIPRRRHRRRLHDTEVAAVYDGAGDGTAGYEVYGNAGHDGVEGGDFDDRWQMDEPSELCWPCRS